METKRVEIIKVRTYLPETGFFVAECWDLHKIGEFLIIVGEAIVKPSGKINVRGNWKTHPTYGKQFSVSRIFYDSLDAIIMLLLESGFVYGIREAKAKAMFDKLGIKVFDVLDACLEEKLIKWNGTEKEPYSLLVSVRGIGNYVAQEIINNWKVQRELLKPAIYSMRAGLTNTQFRMCLSEFATTDDFVDALKNNPYALLSVDCISWDDADTIAFLEWEDKKSIAIDDPVRLSAALKESVRQGLRRGHMAIPVDSAVSAASELAGVDVGEHLETLPLRNMKLVIIDGDFITTTNLYQDERFTALILDELLKSPPLGELRGIDVVSCAPPGMTLGEEQIAALEIALKSRLFILTGGPGTGKTSAFLMTLLEAYSRAGLTYKICAPTGKAAVRVREATGVKAETLHRYFQFYKGEAEKLNEDILIIDEFSMVSGDLLADFIGACRYKTIILIGDQFQLPPVGPGEPLWQLLESKVVPHAHLTKIYRQAKNSPIIFAAHQILEGKVPDSNGDDVVVETVSKDEFAVERVLYHYWNARKSFAAEDVLVIVPVHAGVAGRKELNRILRMEVNPESPLIKGCFFGVGDPVMQTSNNYKIGVMNGEIGYVLQDYENESVNTWTPTGQAVKIKVSFPWGTALYTRDDMDALELAYACTIHKTQGSEIPCVIMVLPRVFKDFYLRQLPFTGHTRAQKKVIAISVQNAYSMFVAGDKRVLRYSLLERMVKDIKGYDQIL